MEPQTINDETLGQLVWDEQVDWWAGQREIAPGLTIPVSVSPNDVALETVLVRAGRTFLRVQQSDASLRQSASEVLLELCNEEWNEEEPISGADFVARMAPKELTIDSDGSATLYYDDGDLFWGHSILVEMDDSGVFQDASIAG
jgi:hypothetical protein